MKKGEKKITMPIRWFYSFIFLGILILLGVGVYAATYTSSGAGHPYTEISTCANGQILKMVNGVWACSSDVDTNTWGPASTGLYGWAMTYNGWCNYKGSTTWRTYSPMYCTSTYSGTPECPSGYLKVMVGSSGSSYYYSCYKS